MRLNVFSRFSYTLETLVQAGQSEMRVLGVPVRVNPPTRPSRLMRSTGEYVLRSIATIVRVYVIYRPAVLFGWLTLMMWLASAVLSVRYLLLATQGEGKGHVQSVIAAGVLAVAGLVLAGIGVVAHLQGVNRRLLEDLRLRQLQTTLNDSQTPE